MGAGLEVRQPSGRAERRQQRATGPGATSRTLCEVDRFFFVADSEAQHDGKQHARERTRMVSDAARLGALHMQLTRSCCSRSPAPRLVAWTLLPCMRLRCRCNGTSCPGSARRR